MPTKRKYKQWKKDPNVPIPKRTLSRLKKGTSSILTANNNESSLEDECFIQRQGTLEIEQTDDFEERYHSHVTEIVNYACQELSDDQDQSESIFSKEDIPEEETGTPDETLTEPDHLKEECDYRDSDSDEDYFRCESTDDENTDPEKAEKNVDTPQPLYPGASITIEESILSIMKYALRHKMSYSALSDLLSLITLHLPPESHTQHLQSLHFLKKAFASQSERNGHEDCDLVTVHEYCPTCLALWKNDIERVCRICGTQRRKKTNNYFLALDIGAQLQSLFKGKALQFKNMNILKIWTTNSSDGTLKAGMISYFLKVLLVEDSFPHHLAAVQELQPHLGERIMKGINVTTLNKDLGCHLRPYQYPSKEEPLTFINIEDIQSKQVVTDCLPESNVMYISSPPNIWEMD